MNIQPPTQKSESTLGQVWDDFDVLPKKYMRHIKFHIGRIEAIGNREALVGGRCCGDEIRKGDRTTIMIKTDGVHEIMRRELMIIFHTIKAYESDVDSVPPGMTAGIIIPDTLAEQMHLNWRLEGECDD